MSAMMGFRLLLSERSLNQGFRAMCRFSSGMRFSKEHEWIVMEDCGVHGRVGITEHAQSSLGEVVYVNIEKVGKSVKKEDSVGVVESSKAASDIYSPVSGQITEANGELKNNPNLINKEPYGKGWLFKIKLENSNQLQDLMTADQYKTFLGSN